MSKHSRFLSLILRHKPEEANLKLDAEGWAPTSDVVKALRSRFGEFSHNDLRIIVDDNDKQRFAIEGNKIRANQGHSVKVDLALPEGTPPAILYHGTKSVFLDSIMRDGLQKGKRHHVHLSLDRETAEKVAARRSGNSIILEIKAGEMTQPFYQSANGVWLTEAVAPEFLTITPSGVPIS